MFQGIFWFCVLAAVHSYAIYPLTLLLLPKRGLRSRPTAPASPPAVSLIIACRNERLRLREKLDNALAVSYPRLEIIVASDCSDDGSDDIVGEYAARGVRLVRAPERRGKEHVQGLAVAAATGEILVFSDAATMLPPESIGLMVENFTDPRVGAVSSEDIFLTPDGTVQGEGAYVRYEMWLRRVEGEVNSLVGLSGSFFAARRAVLRLWNDSIPSDFATAINSVRTGHIAVSDSRVKGVYRDVRDPSAEYPRKVRTVLRGMAGVAQMSEVLNPFRYGVFAYQVWSHKVLRWLVPWLLLGALLANIPLAAGSTFYTLTLLAQLAGYVLVILAHYSARMRAIGPVRIAYYFVQVNVAIAHAAVRFLSGERVTVWQPTVR